MDAAAFSLCRDHRLPVIVFDFSSPDTLERVVRGDASAVLIVINCEGEKYTVIVRQPRFADGLLRLV